MMALTEFSNINNQQNATTFSRPSAIDFSTIDNGHQILSNSVSNSSTNSNTSAFSVSSNQSDNGCPTLPKSFIDKTISPFNETNKAFSDSGGHQCLKPGLIKHPLVYNAHASNSNQANNTAHSPLSPLAHFTHQHLHHLQQTNNRTRMESHLINQQSHQFKPLCRTQNINNNFTKLNDNLHRKMEYTSSSSSTSSGCVSASSSSHHFPSNICCSPGSSGPQTPLTPQSNYVQSPLAQSFTADSGLSLSFRSSQSLGTSNNASNSTINNQTSITDLSNDLSKFSQKFLNRNLDKQDEKFELLSNPSTSASNDESKYSSKIKSNDNTIKKLDLLNKKSNAHKFIEPKSSLLNLPSNKKDTDNESLLSDYSKDLSTASVNNSNLNTLNATSTTNLVSIGQQLSHSTITSKPSLPGASSSFFHYPNIYNPLRNPKNSTKNNKKLIRFMTVCAYVLSVSLVAILLSLYYLFIWNPYTKSNANVTRTFMNSEILVIEKTNYFDVELSAHVGSIIGSSPQSIHLIPNVKVNLNQTESKTIVLPLAAESNQEPTSIERYGGLANSNSEELDSSSIGGTSNNVALNGNGQTTYELRSSRMPTALSLKYDKATTYDKPSAASISMDSEQSSNDSGEINQQSKLISLLRPSNDHQSIKQATAKETEDRHLEKQR